MTKRTTIIAAVFVLMVLSCGKIEQLPDEPRVEFRSFTLFDSVDLLGNTVKAGRLTFYFEDGDGDLGLDEPDSLMADTTNLFLTLFRKTDGLFTEADEDDELYPSSYRIPYMEVSGQNKILRGTIDVSMLYYIYNDTDTVYYDFCIEDRAGNMSNTDSTCVIVLGSNGTYIP